MQVSRRIEEFFCADGVVARSRKPRWAHTSRRRPDAVGNRDRGIARPRLTRISQSTLVSKLPPSNPGGSLRSLHHCFLHSVFASPIQTDLVAIGIIQIGMAPTPGHHAWQLGHVEALFLEIAAKVIERADFEIQTYTFTQNGIFRTRLMQSDRAVAAGCAQARIHWLFVIHEVFDELASQQFSVEVDSALNVFHVEHSVIESKLPAII